MFNPSQWFISANDGTNITAHKNGITFTGTMAAFLQAYGDDFLNNSANVAVGTVFPATAKDFDLFVCDSVWYYWQDGKWNLGAGIDNNVTGALTAAHYGKLLITSGNVIIPKIPGFRCKLIAGGAHTVTFNSLASAAMAAGDIMEIDVQSETVIHAVKTAAANKVTFA